MNNSGLSIVLGSYNRKNFLKKTIKSARNELERLEQPAEIIVIDGGSNDGTLGWLTQQKDIISIVQHNRGDWQGRKITSRSWGYFMNLGFQCAQGKYICMLSDDCVFIPGSLKKGYDEFEQLLSQGKKVGALAFYWRNWPTRKKYYVTTVKGQVYLNHGMYLREAVAEVGYINEDDYFFYCADTDLCLRLLRAGYAVEATDKALIEHSQHINVKVRRGNKGKGKEKIRHDETALQANWEDFFSDVKYADSVDYRESNIVPNDTVARKAFGRVARIHRVRASLQCRLRRLGRMVFSHD